MRAFYFGLKALPTLAWSVSALSLPSSTYKELRYDSDPTYWTFEEGVGHFSEWSKSTKRDFIDDVRAGKADEWVVVMGNEGGGE